jgi:hypothetical protein
MCTLHSRWRKSYERNSCKKRSINKIRKTTIQNQPGNNDHKLLFHSHSLLGEAKIKHRMSNSTARTFCKNCTRIHTVRTDFIFS